MIGQIDITAHVWSQWMFDMFWQVSLLIILVMFIETATRRRAWPPVRYALWGLVFLKLLIPPTWQMPTGIVSLIQPTVSEHMSVQVENTLWPEESSLTSDLTEQPTNQVLESTTVEKATWPTILFLIWIAGMLFFGLLLVIQMSRLPKRSQRWNERDAPEWFNTVLVNTSTRLHLKNTPAVIFSRKAGSPAVYGLLHPVLVLPRGYFDHLGMEQAEHVLLHELCHIKRGDLWIHWFCVLLQIVYWFNPLLILARRQFGHVSEICCDLTVAGVLREKTPDYRETLLNTSRMFLANTVEPGMGLLGIFEEPFRIVARLKWLEQKTWEHRKRKIAATMVTILIMVGFVMPMAAHTLPEENKNEFPRLTARVEEESVKEVDEIERNGKRIALLGTVKSEGNKYAVITTNPIEGKGMPENRLVKEGDEITNLFVDRIEKDNILVRDGEQTYRILMTEVEKKSTSVPAQIPEEKGSSAGNKVAPGIDPEPTAIDSEVRVDLNMVDVDIVYLIKAISEMTGKNFIIDPKVRGKVTIVSPEKVSKEEAYRIFESVMELNGYALVPSGEVIKVVPASPATPRKVEGTNKLIRLDRAQVDSDLENLTELMTQATVKPYSEGGVEGLAISNIKAGSLYRRMGLRNGDILINVDDQPITSVDQMIAFYDRLKLSDTFTIGLKRRGQDRTITCRIQAEKATKEIPASKTKPGKAERAAKPEKPERANRNINLNRDQVNSALENPTELIGQITIKPYSEEGVKGFAMSGIGPGSFFRKMGFRNGDILVDVNKQPMTTVDQMLALYESMKSSDTASLGINRRGRDITITYSIQ